MIYKLGVCAMVLCMGQEVYAMDLRYMMHPPAERSLEQIEQELHEARSADDRDKMIALHHEMAEKLAAIVPSAGESATGGDYGHMLGH